MRLDELQPNLPATMQDRERMHNTLGMLDMITKASMENPSGEGGGKYRPPSMGLDQIVNTWVRQQVQFRAQLMSDLFTIANSVGEIRGPINHITGEVFRRGLNWLPKFTVKCEVCGTEYQEQVAECKTCVKNGNIFDLREPDEAQKTTIEGFFDDANIWDQSLEDILKQFHFDLNALDDAYLLLEKEYFAADDNPDSPVLSKVTGIRHLFPGLIEFDLDQEGLPKNAHFFCYIHRDTDSSSEPGQCPTCGRDMMPAMYRYMHRGKSVFFFDSEIIHQSKFNPSETYGWSPILTIFEKTLTIVGMDKNVYRYFYERTMPASMIMVFTDDPENLRRERDDIAAKTRLDPNYVPMVAVSSRTNRGRVDMVRMFHTLQEMDYLPVREEIRERISAMWGVTPAWQGAPEAFGGMSTQTQQLVVMSRVVESDQRMFHEKIFPQILDAFGITDWKLELPVPEEKAEATRIQFAQQRVGVAQQLVTMGFSVKIKAQESGIDSIDFIVSGEATDPNAVADPNMSTPGMMDGFAPSDGTEEAEGDSAENPTGDGTMGEIQMSMNTPPAWTTELQNLGFSQPLIKSLSGNKVWFEDISGKEYIGFMNLSGQIVRSEPATYRKIPQRSITSAAETRTNNKVFGADAPEGLDEI
jgi:hypothetical protein